MMINDGIKNVPEKTIAIIPSQLFNGEYVPMDRIKNILEKCDYKRDWFDKHFYKCLPLTIANSYGFLIKSEFAFDFEWNGGNQLSDLKIDCFDNYQEKYPYISSHFGHGIITIHVPFILRTPPNVNILTINPPNYIVPNITVMNGSVETDNLRRSFTFNLKVQYPNLKTHVPANTPLAAFIPIPRYFADSFDLKNAFDLFDEEIIKEEDLAALTADKIREHARQHNPEGLDRCYYSGKDPFGNEFKDHQKPRKLAFKD